MKNSFQGRVSKRLTTPKWTKGRIIPWEMREDRGRWRNSCITAKSVTKCLIIPSVWSSIWLCTQAKSHSSANRAAKVSSVHPRCLRTCWFTQTRALSNAISAERDFTRNLTWRNIPTSTRAKNHTSAASVASHSVSHQISSHTVESIKVSSHSRARNAAYHSCAKWTWEDICTPTKWRIERIKRAFHFLFIWQRLPSGSAWWSKLWKVLY